MMMMKKKRHHCCVRNDFRSRLQNSWTTPQISLAHLDLVPVLFTCGLAAVSACLVHTSKIFDVNVIPKEEHNRYKVWDSRKGNQRNNKLHDKVRLQLLQFLGVS